MAKSTKDLVNEGKANDIMQKLQNEDAFLRRANEVLDNPKFKQFPAMDQKNIVLQIIKTANERYKAGDTEITKEVLKDLTDKVSERAANLFGPLKNSLSEQVMQDPNLARDKKVNILKAERAMEELAPLKAEIATSKAYTQTGDRRNLKVSSAQKTKDPEEWVNVDAKISETKTTRASNPALYGTNPAQKFRAKLNEEKNKASPDPGAAKKQDSSFKPGNS